MIVEKTLKNAEKFICEECNFKCSKQSDYNRHLSTRKHQMIINGNTNDNEKASKIYMCDCGKQYKFSSGLSRHKQKCNYQKEETPNVKPEDTSNIINTLVADNKEMRDMFLMFIKNHSESQSDMTKNIDSIKNRKQK